MRLSLRAAAALLAAAAGCAGRHEPLERRIDKALARACAALVDRQSADGAFRSEVYGAFRDGLTLTAPALKALYFAGGADPDARRVFEKGAAFLIRHAPGPDATGEAPLLFPVYTASMASFLLRDVPEIPGSREARKAWHGLLLDHRLGGENGWRPGDPCHGGWGYAVRRPIRPAEGPSPYEANVSSTLFAVLALRASGTPEDRRILEEAVPFLFRCQNFAEAGAGDPRFDDGGFFFTPADPGRNKAGSAGTDRRGRERFASYGSATADGLRALLRCGLPPDHPRVAAARAWIERHYSARSNPGDFAPDREILRDGMYYYYAWSLAHAFLALDADRMRTPAGEVDWPAELSRELLGRQRPDGTWANPFAAGKEDDPLIATPLAMGALSIARGMLSKR